MSEDPVKMRHKQLKRAQKLQTAITEYINDSEPQLVQLDSQALRNLHQELTKEQNTINEQISKLLD